MIRFDILSLRAILLKIEIGRKGNKNIWNKQDFQTENIILLTFSESHPKKIENFYYVTPIYSPDIHETITRLLRDNYETITRLLRDYYETILDFSPGVNLTFTRRLPDNHG